MKPNSSSTSSHGRSSPPSQSMPLRASCEQCRHSKVITDPSLPFDQERCHVISLARGQVLTLQYLTRLNANGGICEAFVPIARLAAYHALLPLLCKRSRKWKETGLIACDDASCFRLLTSQGMRSYSEWRVA